MEIQDVGVQAVFDEIGRSAGRVAADRRIRFLCDGEAGVSLRADPTRLRQVLLILLDNAFQHTPQDGVVELRARSEPGQVRIEVQDSGPGVDPSDLPHLFERFYRSAANGSGRGTGLGLAIAKTLVEAQAGTIVLENTPLAGTVARIRLPAA
jgi:signal transduction histidine kinase